MITESGRTRWVVALPSLGIVLKFAIFRWCRFPGQTWPQTFSDGWLANLRERRFYRRTHHPFCWPTWFSLFGLVNIQPMASSMPVRFSWRFFLAFFPDYQTFEDALWPDHHAFNDRVNFCIDDEGYIRMLDYGSAAAGEVIKTHGHLLHRPFTPPTFSS